MLLDKTKEFAKHVMIMALTVAVTMFVAGRYNLISKDQEAKAAPQADDQTTAPPPPAPEPDPAGVQPAVTAQASSSTTTPVATVSGGKSPDPSAGDKAVSDAKRLEAAPCTEADKGDWYWVNVEAAGCAVVAQACSESLEAYDCTRVTGGAGNTSITVRDYKGNSVRLPARNVTTFAPWANGWHALEWLHGKGSTLSVRHHGVTITSNRWVLVRSGEATAITYNGGGGARPSNPANTRPSGDDSDALKKRVAELERQLALPREVVVLVDPRPPIETRKAIARW